jgi:phosphatidate phosphatase LPIN
LIPYRKYKKTLFLSSDDLKKLNLKYGKNDITYSCQNTYGGAQENTSRVFFWNYKVKIVISDVDGTITKSDVLGHILPRFGKDWSHHGVAELFTNISGNGYEFLYLTSRAIGMADSTRSYLTTLEQEDNYMLPDGPLLMSPDRLMHSFKREVIDRKPHLFKIAALWNVKSLFRDNVNPFYAGFGNRETDAISYRAVGIGFRKIFIINPQSEVIIMQSMYKKTYATINDILDQVFPPVCSKYEHAL